MQIDAPPKDGEANAALLDYISSVRVLLLRIINVDYIIFCTSGLFIAHRFFVKFPEPSNIFAGYMYRIDSLFTELSYIEIYDMYYQSTTSVLE